MIEAPKTGLLQRALAIEHRWPENITQMDLDDFRNEKSYTTSDVYLKKYNNVWVSSDAVVYKNGILVAETMASAENHNYYRLRYLVKKLLTGRKKSLNRNKKYLLVTDSWSVGHFHWICDVLPRLLSIRNHTKDFVLLLQDSSYTRKIALQSLQLLKLEFDDIILMSDGDSYNIRELYFVSKIAPSGWMHSVLMNELRNEFIAGKQTGNKRVYISRSKAAVRKILNEVMLVPVLKLYGFEVLHAEDLSLSEQIDIFSSADTIAGIHGAGLTNCIFMQPDSNIIELRRKENGPTNVGYWHLADSLSQKYYYYNGVPDSNKPLVGRGCNLTIALDDFEDKILKKL